MKMKRFNAYAVTLCMPVMFCQLALAQAPKDSPKPAIRYANEPLVKSMYTADPSAHVFNGKIYIYPSHDVETGKSNSNGDHYDMKDYHVFSMDSIGATVKDHGAGLKLSQVNWAERQLWAPDAAYKDGKYYLYFPAKDKQGIFRIGVAVSKSPTGPFKAEPSFIAGTYSIDPCVFQDEDQENYMYFGGLWGGQLQKWASGSYAENEDRKEVRTAEQPALSAKIAKLDGTMLKLAEPPKDVILLDESGNQILSGDRDRRFFEGVWVFKHNNIYYFTYSTGDTHKICYATGKSPYGPFTYQGVILNPVAGWTTHHSIIKFQERWYLFYHDTELSGKNHLRNIKVMPMEILPDGRIKTADSQIK